ncbi:MAG: hypothetical protein KDD82_21050 [Planctomycetes bacterium]|nr:hypothetical protein [Planctomycetota bacterium]
MKKGAKRATKKAQAAQPQVCTLPLPRDQWGEPEVVAHAPTVEGLEQGLQAIGPLDGVLRVDLPRGIGQRVGRSMEACVDPLSGGVNLRVCLGGSDFPSCALVDDVSRAVALELLLDFLEGGERYAERAWKALGVPYGGSALPPDRFGLNVVSADRWTVWERPDPASPGGPARRREDDGSAGG